MYFAKTSLEAAVGIKGATIVVLTRDGGTFAMSGETALVISPSDQRYRDALPEVLRSEVPLAQDCIVPAESIREIVAAIGRDKLYDGLLEGCVMTDEAGSAKIKVVIATGRTRHESTINKMAQNAYDWKETLRTLYASRVECDHTAMMFNRGRAVVALEIIKSACGYSSDFESVAVRILSKNLTEWRAVNRKNGSRIVVITGGAGVGCPELTSWEQSLTGIAGIPAAGVPAMPERKLVLCRRK